MRLSPLLFALAILAAQSASTAAASAAAATTAAVTVGGDREGGDTLRADEQGRGAAASIAVLQRQWQRLGDAIAAQNTTASAIAGAWEERRRRLTALQWRQSRGDTTEGAAAAGTPPQAARQLQATEGGITSSGDLKFVQVELQHFFKIASAILNCFLRFADALFLLSFFPSILLSFFPSLLLSFFPSFLLSFASGVLLISFLQSPHVIALLRLL